MSNAAQDVAGLMCWFPTPRHASQYMCLSHCRAPWRGLAWYPAPACGQCAPSCGLSHRCGDGPSPPTAGLMTLLLPVESPPGWGLRCQPAIPMPSGCVAQSSRPTEAAEIALGSQGEGGGWAGPLCFPLCHRGLRTGRCGQFREDRMLWEAHGPSLACSTCAAGGLEGPTAPPVLSPARHRYLLSKLPASAPQHTHTYTHTTHSHHTHAHYTHTPPTCTPHRTHCTHTYYIHHTTHTSHTHPHNHPSPQRSISNHPTPGTQPADLPGRRGVNLITGLVCLPPGWENINTSSSLGGREQGGEELFKAMRWGLQWSWALA